MHAQKIAGVAGSENYLLQLLPHLKAEGLHVEMTALVERLDMPENEGFIASLERSGIGCHQILVGRYPDPRTAFKLALLLRAGGFDLLHSHLIFADVIAAMSGLMFPKVRVVSTKHGYREAHLAKRGLSGSVDRSPYWLLAKAAEHGIDRSFAVSRGLRELYVKSGICDPKRIDVIHHGLPESGIEDDTATRYAAHQVIVPGRLVECKGHIHLLQAFPEVLARHPDAVLVVVGDGPERLALQSRSKELGIEDAVRFVGWQNNVIAWISKSDVVVIPSIGEGFGLVFLEAYVAQRPVVAFDVAPSNEILRNAETGFLVPPFDTSKMALAIADLLDDPKLRARLGSEGRRVLSEHFSWERMVQETLAFYADAIGSAA
jgi:glycosyltransferase involved in cell wall biosynthesis